MEKGGRLGGLLIGISLGCKGSAESRGRRQEAGFSLPNAFKAVNGLNGTASSPAYLNIYST